MGKYQRKSLFVLSETIPLYNLFRCIQKNVILYNKIKNKSCDKLATPPPLAVAMGISFLISSDRSAIADVSLAIADLWLIYGE